VETVFSDLPLENAIGGECNWYNLIYCEEKNDKKLVLKYFFNFYAK
jgi:hypothetical protein